MLAPERVNGTLLLICLVAMVIAFFRVYGGPSDVIKDQQPLPAVEEKVDVARAEVLTKGTIGMKTITVFKHEEKDFTIFFTSEGGLVINKK